MQRAPAVDPGAGGSAAQHPVAPAPGALCYNPTHAAFAPVPLPLSNPTFRNIPVWL